ncbi:MAG TPA: FAD-binding oxidoreductase [Poseidonia sp.]|nr:FAD-binding oxidoreductase [Poseidonia sp.]
MARVTVIGAGLSGLTAALYATTAGHHVVILDRSDRVGGRGTSESLDGIPFGFGPHLLHSKGPLAKITKKVSRLKMVLGNVRIDRLHVVGIGPLRPRGNVKQAAILRRVLKGDNQAHAAVFGARLLSDMGATPQGEDRFQTLLKGKLCVIGEGWSGVVGRLASALDEVGVLIEAGCDVVAVEKGRVRLADARELETDIIIIACGWKKARKLLSPLWQDDEPNLQPVLASTVDVALTSRPLSQRHGIIDGEQGVVILDYGNIQPRLKLGGSLLSSVAFERTGESHEARLERLNNALDDHAPGWRKHIIHERQQRTITVQTVGQKPRYDALCEQGILLAGEWVASDYALSDGAAQTGKAAGQGVSSTLN